MGFSSCLLCIDSTFHHRPEALTKKKCQRIFRTQRMNNLKRPAGAIAKARARAKAKVAAAPPAAPVPAAPEEEPVPEPPEPAPILPRPPRRLGVGYKYIPVDPHADIVFNTALFKINAHCSHPHLDIVGQEKCHMDRSVAHAAVAGVRVKGRPIGFLVAWLKRSPASKVEHTLLKTQLWREECFEERRQARSELWEMRHEYPDVLELFAIELQYIVPPDFGDAPQLWEPTCVF